MSWQLRNTRNQPSPSITPRVLSGSDCMEAGDSLDRLPLWLAVNRHHQSNQEIAAPLKPLCTLASANANALGLRVWFVCVFLGITWNQGCNNYFPSYFLLSSFKVVKIMLFHSAWQYHSYFVCSFSTHFHKKADIFHVFGNIGILAII